MLLAALKTYAAFCTLLITAYLLLILWSIWFPTPAAENSEASLKFSYDQYLAKESPKREDYFCNLAVALAMRTKQTPVPTADMFNYLGKPDLIAGTVETGTLAYLHTRSGITNRYAIYAFVSDGKLKKVGFGDAKDLSEFQAYAPR